MKTTEEIRSEFLSSIKQMVDYWYNHKDECETEKDLLSSLAFSILVILDGMSGSFEHPIQILVDGEDGKTHDLHGGHMLHDLWYEED